MNFSNVYKRSRLRESHPTRLGSAGSAHKAVIHQAENSAPLLAAVGHEQTFSLVALTV